MLTVTVPATVHGRYLYEQRDVDRLLVGFHGYAEVAETHLAELSKIPEVEKWSVVSVQALHPFYTRSGEVVANWMTRLDRELAVQDNIEYVRNVLASLPTPGLLVFSGFSQGASMAARAAAAIPCAGLIMLGGDLPPDVTTEGAQLPPVLLARGTSDDWYTDAKFQADLRFLEGRTAVTSCVFDGGHEWSNAFRAVAADFLAGLRG